MPTGYTADVESGKIDNLRDYALICARAFGALVDMRDEPFSKPIPKEFEVSDYHLKQIDSIKQEINDFKLLSKEDRKALYIAEYKREMEEHERYTKSLNDANDRYRAMIKRVEDWEPPTEKHSPLKEFMLTQLYTSIITYFPQQPRKLNYSEWIEKKTKKFAEDLQYHTEAHDKDVRRVESNNKWVRELREALDNE